MKNLIMKLRNGNEVELTEDDMMKIHQHYEIQCTADYLREDHADWSEEKVQEIATETRRQMYRYDFTEDEAIREAILNLGYEMED